MCDICDGKVTKRESMALMRDRILRNGWAIQYVESDGSEQNPAFAYTVGLSRVDHPEFICFGVHPECASRVLRPLAEAVRHGRRFEEGSDLGDVFHDYEDPGALLWFPDSSTHLYVANLFYRAAGARPIPALQVYLPSMLRLLDAASTRSG